MRLRRRRRLGQRQRIGRRSGLQTVSSGTLTVCSDVPYPPFEDFDETSESGFKGFDIDIVQAIADGLELELAVKDSAFDALQSGQALNAGQCDIGRQRDDDHRRAQGEPRLHRGLLRLAAVAAGPDRLRHRLASTTSTARRSASSRARPARPTPRRTPRTPTIVDVPRATREMYQRDQGRPGRRAPAGPPGQHRAHQGRRLRGRREVRHRRGSTASPSRRATPRCVDAVNEQLPTHARRRHVRRDLRQVLLDQVTSPPVDDGARRRREAHAPAQAGQRASLYAVLRASAIVARWCSLADWAAIRENFFDTEVGRGRCGPDDLITIGAKNTVIYTVIAFAGRPARSAVVLALMRLSPVAPTGGSRRSTSSSSAACRPCS